MLDFIRSTLNPQAYHGRFAQPPFFEGWYFKLIDTTEQHRYAIIPGVFKSKDDQTSHCFVQVLNGATGQSSYHTYPYDKFWSAAREFDIRVGPNQFSLERIHLEIDRPELSLHGDLSFTGGTPWPVTLTSPGIMGWYAWVPQMECYHGVLSFDHTIQGELIIDGDRIDFSGGRGYIEKDWGKSFPAAWIWFQSNHFENPGTCITASVAIIPWIGRAFPGFIIGLWHENKLYRFATYSGARIEKLDITDHQVRWSVADRALRLEMQAVRAKGGLIHAPTPTGMDRRIAETLTAEVSVRLSRLKGEDNEPIFSGTGRHAGLEVIGDLRRMVSMLRKTQPGSVNISEAELPKGKR